jgi:hypothetical protein
LTDIFSPFWSNLLTHVRQSWSWLPGTKKFGLFGKNIKDVEKAYKIYTKMFSDRVSSLHFCNGINKNLISKLGQLVQWTLEMSVDQVQRLLNFFCTLHDSKMILIFSSWKIFSAHSNLIFLPILDKAENAGKE